MYFKFLWAVLLVCFMCFCAASEKLEKKDLKIIFNLFDNEPKGKYVKVIPLIDDNGIEIVPCPPEAELT